MKKCIGSLSLWLCLVNWCLLFAGCTSCPPSDQLRGAGSGLVGGRLVFEDSFEALSEHWHSLSDTWRVEEGALLGANARNDALWLDLALPERVRIEFDATALSEVGDIKFEVFGDGSLHESGYIAIYGGWQNSLTIIARLDEHGEDRLVARQHIPVEAGRTYRFSVVRTDHRLRWYIDGQERLVYEDQAPLRGDDHAYFAFNTWVAPVRFDNLAIYDLGE